MHYPYFRHRYSVHPTQSPYIQQNISSPSASSNTKIHPKTSHNIHTQYYRHLSCNSSIPLPCDSLSNSISSVSPNRSSLDIPRTMSCIPTHQMAYTDSHARPPTYSTSPPSSQTSDIDPQTLPTSSCQTVADTPHTPNPNPPVYHQTSSISHR